MTAATIFYFLLLLACPLMMLFMMRGHGHGRERRDGLGQASTDELRRRRDALDELIRKRETGEAEQEPTPWVSPR